MRSSFLHILCAVFLSAVSPAQQLPFRTYSGKDGLIRSTVHTICQDRQGFMWFGTSDGVSRYDGASFSNFMLPGGLISNFINEFFVDTLNRVWIASNFNGVTLYSDGAFSSYPVVPDSPTTAANRVNTFLQLPGGALLAGTDAGVFTFDGKDFLKVFEYSPLSRMSVLKMHLDRSANIWIATSGGLFKAQRSDLTSCSAVEGFAGRTIYAIAEDSDGYLWFSTDGGLKKVNRMSSLEPLPRALQVLRDQPLRALLYSRQGSLWIGTPSSGVFEWTAKGVLNHFTIENGLAGNRVIAIHEDREGILWFATNAGVSKLVHTDIVNYYLSAGLLYNYVGAIASTDRDAMWFGTPFGLSKWSAGRYSTYSKAHGLPGEFVLSLLHDAKQRLWVGTNNGLCMRLSRPSEDRFIRPVDGFAGPNRIARVLFEDKDKRIWAGRASGLSLWDGNSFRPYELPHSPGADNLVLAIVQDDGGDLWVGTQNNGIFQFAIRQRPGGGISLHPISHLLVSDGLPDQNIRAAMKDAAGNLWFGTRFSGTFKLVLNNGAMSALERFSTKEGLSGDWVRALMQDRRGDIWIATNRGVDRLQVTSEGSRHLSTLTLADGLAGDDVHSLYEDPQGYLWFGATNGATRYTPPPETERGIPPAVYITRFQVFGQDDSLAMQRLHADLSYSQHSVAFEFIGISFKDESRMQYQFRLDGFDTSRSAWTSRRYVNYTHLPSGGYTFRVRARNGDGVTSLTEAAFSFTVGMPFWESWWFIALALLTVALAVYGMHRMRVRRLLEAERVRSRIAADLHDDIGSTLSSIAIFSKLAKEESASASPQASALFDRIGESARSMLERLDDIVWAINPENDSLEDITLRMRQYATELFEGKGLSFTLEMPHDNSHKTLPMEKRRHLYLIFKEGVNNIVKHSACSHASILLRTKEGGLELVLKDNGRGFSANGSGTGNGLKNMLRRAAAVGGRLRVESAPNEGTTVTFDLTT